MQSLQEALADKLIALAFIPEQIKQRTLDNPEYWTYVQEEVKEIATELLNDNATKNKLDMGW